MLRLSYCGWICVENYFRWRECGSGCMSIFGVEWDRSIEMTLWWADEFVCHTTICTPKSAPIRSPDPWIGILPVHSIQISIAARTFRFSPVSVSAKALFAISTEKPISTSRQTALSTGSLTCGVVPTGNRVVLPFVADRGLNR